nr:proline-rich protein 4-like [Halyomorpha halys]
MRPLTSAFVFFILTTQLTKSKLRYIRESHINMRRCDDGEEWRPFDGNNNTEPKEEKKSSDLVIGSDSHEDYALQVVGKNEDRHQINGDHTSVKLVPIDKLLHVPTNQRILSPLPIPVPVEVKEPFELNIPVPVKMEKELVVPVERIVYNPVVRPVPVKIVKEVHVPIRRPYPVLVPFYKLKLVIHSKEETPPTQIHSHL